MPRVASPLHGAHASRGADGIAEVSLLDGGGDFFQDGCCRLRWVGCLRNRSADYELASARSNGIAWSRYAFLVAYSGTGRPDARNDQMRVCAKLLTQKRNFFRRANQTTNVCVDGHACQPQYLLGGPDFDANGGQLRPIHAGQHRDREQLRSILCRGRCLRRCVEHGGSAGGVNRQ